MIVVLGAAVVATNFLVYEAIARIPLGAAMTLVFLGPLALALLAAQPFHCASQAKDTEVVKARPDQLHADRQSVGAGRGISRRRMGQRDRGEPLGRLLHAAGRDVELHHHRNVRGGRFQCRVADAVGLWRRAHVIRRCRHWIGPEHRRQCRHAGHLARSCDT